LDEWLILAFVRALEKIKNIILGIEKIVPVAFLAVLSVPPTPSSMTILSYTCIHYCPVRSA
jgi:hypothetical protein